MWNWCFLSGKGWTLDPKKSASLKCRPGRWLTTLKPPIMWKPLIPLIKLLPPSSMKLLLSRSPRIHLQIGKPIHKFLVLIWPWLFLPWIILFPWLPAHYTHWIFLLLSCFLPVLNAPTCWCWCFSEPSTWTSPCLSNQESNHLVSWL